MVLGTVGRGQPGLTPAAGFCEAGTLSQAARLIVCVPASLVRYLDLLPPVCASPLPFHRRLRLLWASSV